MRPEDFDPPHRIRLRGPWEYERLAPGVDPPDSPPHGRIKLPFSWSEAFGACPGPIRLTRRFGRPDGSADIARAWLEVESSATEVSIGLNGEALASMRPGRIRLDVTRLLDERNRLALDLAVDRPPADDRPIIEVALWFEAEPTDSASE